MKTPEVIAHIVNWLADYSKESNSKGFVVGVSGGIDSAVSSVLAAKTGLPLLCVEMPIHQSEAQVSRAREHIKFLKSNYPDVSSVEIELTKIFDGFVNAVPQVENETVHEMSLVNARARLRMTALYYFAGINNYLVVGTGNKVEDFGIGFFTKYGDGGVDLSPIADLTKSEVYELGKELDVIGTILEAPPTDGLWGDDRTDEDQLGASYPELEWAMEFSSNEDELTLRQKEVLAIYRKMHLANKHKMKPIPICVIPAELKQ